MEPLPPTFFAREPAIVARDLLGCILIGRGCTGVVVETEAYHETEPASHSFLGRTERTAPMFGPAGRAYVYFTYGMHWCANVVTGLEDEGAAVLLRAVAPWTGIDAMRERRAVRRRAGSPQLRERELCSGPAKLAQAFDMRASDNGHDLTGSREPMLARDPAAVAGLGLEEARLLVGPRVGISVATELPWRFGLDSPWLSRPFPRQ